MTFHAIKSNPGSRREPLLISIRRLRATPRVRLTIHPDLLRQIGWSERTALQPFIGEGPDSGLVMIKPAASGKAFQLRKVTASARLALEFNVPPPTPDTWASTEPEFRADTIAKSLTIRLPWHTSVRRAAE